MTDRMLWKHASKTRLTILMSRVSCHGCNLESSTTHSVVPICAYSAQKRMIHHWILEVPKFPSTPDVAFQWCEALQFVACWSKGVTSSRSITIEPKSKDRWSYFLLGTYVPWFKLIGRYQQATCFTQFFQAGCNLWINCLNQVPQMRSYATAWWRSWAPWESIATCHDCHGIVTQVDCQVTPADEAYCILTFAFYWLNGGRCRCWLQLNAIDCMLAAVQFIIPIIFPAPSTLEPKSR